ncbi:MAG: hypothetical protein AAB866_02610 [Patescibacteria group bacterium]
MNKHGLSEIVVSLILVALTVVAVVIVGAVVNNLIGENIKKSESCFGNFGKITIDEKYTCFDDSNKKVQFAISIGDVDVDSVLVSIATRIETGSFTITNEDQTIAGLKYLDGSSPVKLPAKNGGKTYLYDFDARPNAIQIAPIIDGTQCEVSDVVTDIDDCSLLA